MAHRSGLWTALWVEVSPYERRGPGWVARLPGPVAVTCEAGPTGFGLARAFAAVGVRCVIVAPSKLERPPGDRVRTDVQELQASLRMPTGWGAG